jgi:putative membrane protein (TIGR04086 family)
MNSTAKNIQLRSFHCISSGLLYSFISMIVLTIIVSFFLLLTDLKENSLTVYIFFIHGISLLIGGYVTGKRIGKKGWYYGGIMGVIYSIIILLIGFLGFDSSTHLTSLLLIMLSFTTGALGGIIGVNKH